MRVLLILGLVLLSSYSEAWRIIDGKRVPHGKYPFIVSLQNRGRHFCGGSIVDANTILTAAHCFYGRTSGYTYDIVAGVSTLTSKPSTSQTRRVSRIVIHPNYNSNIAYIYGNDIALLKLSTPLDLNAHSSIKAVSLPSQGDETVKPGENCFVAGWGSTDPRGASATTILYEGGVQVISNDDCAKVFSRTRNNPAQICAGGHTSTNACRGDSGGPLFCSVSGSIVQVGVVSYGKVPCGQSGIPTVYTRASNYRTWINTN